MLYDLGSLKSIKILHLKFKVGMSRRFESLTNIMDRNEYIASSYGISLKLFGSE